MTSHGWSPTGPVPPPPRSRKYAPPSPLSPVGLLLNVIGSGVVALLLSTVKAPEPGTIIGAGIMALVTALVLTPGRRQWLRVVGAAAVAFLLAFTGITIPELFLGHSLANPDRATTYSVPGKKEPVNNPSGGGGGSQPGVGVPDIVITPDVVDCGTVDLGSIGTCSTIVWSTGTANLRITRIDSPDPAGEFTVDGCVGLSLPPEAACELHITFTPAAADTRTAQIVVHQNIPLPDRGTVVTLTGTGGAGPITTEPPPPPPWPTPSP